MVRIYGLVVCVLGTTNVESIAQLAISISISKGRPLGHGYRKKTRSRSTQLVHLLIEHEAIQERM